MDCVQAQQVISDRMDGLPVDAAVLEQARQHVLTCPSCAEFVTVMRAVQDAPAPQPPADLTDRVMAAVHAAATEREAAQQAAAALDVSAKPDAVPVRARSGPADRGALIRWTAIAATVFLAAGIGAVVGSRYLTSGGVDDAALTSVRTAVTAQDSAPAGAEVQSSAAPQDAPAAGSIAAAAAPSAIVVDNVVFVLSSGDAQVDEKALTKAGTTQTALDGTQSPTSREVFALQDSSRVYLREGDRLLAFDRVTRAFDGTQYALTSGPIPAYGVWPSLPAEIPAPTSDDGAPTFLVAGNDSQGVTVYRLATADPARGIAVAPGTAATDPAAGNPSWTWWTPVR